VSRFSGCTATRPAQQLALESGSTYPRKRHAAGVDLRLEAQHHRSDCNHGLNDLLNLIIKHRNPRTRVQRHHTRINFRRPTADAAEKSQERRREASGSRTHKNLKDKRFMVTRFGATNDSGCT